jgi:hypothetical protein
LGEEVEEQAEQQSTGPSLASRGCGWIGCLLIICILVALGAGIYFAGNALEPLADKYLWQPHDVVREYLIAYEDGNNERAQHFLCSDVPRRQLLDPSEPLGKFSTWTAAVEDTFPYPRANGRFAIYYELTTATGSPTGQALLQREDDGWRICDFTT